MGPFLKLDDRLLQDDKIRKLIKQKGYDGLGIYLALLTLIRNYKEHMYKIPFEEISEIAEWDLKVPEEHLRSVLDSCIEIGLFSSTETLFWSERRKNELVKAEEISAKKSEGGKRGLESRWSNRK